MMYQRAAMYSLSVRTCAGASDLVEQPAHRAAEDRIDAEEEHRQDHHHDRDEDRRARGFRPGRPHHLAGLGANLAEELAGVGLGHLARASRIEPATIAFRHRTIAAPG